MNTAIASPESSVGFFRNMYNNARDAFNHMDEQPAPALGYFCVMGGVLVAAAGYLLADGVVSRSAAEVVIGAGSAPVGAKYAHSTGTELLRRRRARPQHPELEGPKDAIEEIAGIVKDSLDRSSINQLMREQGLDTDGKSIDEYLDTGAQDLEDFANGNDNDQA